MCAHVGHNHPGEKLVEERLHPIAEVPKACLVTSHQREVNHCYRFGSLYSITVCFFSFSCPSHLVTCKFYSWAIFGLQITSLLLVIYQKSSGSLLGCRCHIGLLNGFYSVKCFSLFPPAQVLYPFIIKEWEGPSSPTCSLFPGPRLLAQSHCFERAQ